MKKWALLKYLLCQKYSLLFRSFHSYSFLSYDILIFFTILKILLADNFIEFVKLVDNMPFCNQAMLRAFQIINSLATCLANMLFIIFKIPQWSNDISWFIKFIQTSQSSFCPQVNSWYWSQTLKYFYQNDINCFETSC